MKQIPVCSLEETGELGLKLASLIKPGMLITLSGDLGAGKTTFTKYLGKGLGVKKTINSPTFTILKIYQGTSMPVYHIDPIGWRESLRISDLRSILRMMVYV